jgi:hypothetical protein
MTAIRNTLRTLAVPAFLILLSGLHADAAAGRRPHLLFHSKTAETQVDDGNDTPWKLET